jgi:hypothetical protein
VPALPVDLRPVVGRHDLFLVFTNDTAKEDAPLMSFASVRLTAVPGR